MPGITWIGQTLGERYRIEEPLGQGGMSAVYKASDPNLRRVVAIKMIHAHLSNNPEFVRRFEEEAAAVAQLRHENIIQVYDFNHDGDVYYMVLEYIPGETLQERLRRPGPAGQRMEPAEAVRFMIQMGDAVQYAHERGMIHRDIKPANMMLDVRGRAVLMDFGIARIVGGHLHTATGAVIGTAMYMSPEQVRGDRADERSDIYSLGITLYEALSGRPPFLSDSAMTLMMMHLQEPVPDIRRYQPDTPDLLVNILARALEKRPENRYQSAGEMATALRLAYAQITGQPVPGIAMAGLSPMAGASPTPPAFGGQPAVPGAVTPPAQGAVTPPAQGAVTPPAQGAVTPPEFNSTITGQPNMSTGKNWAPVAQPTPAPGASTAPGTQPAPSADRLHMPVLLGAGVLAIVALVALLMALQVLWNTSAARATPAVQGAQQVLAATPTFTLPPPEPSPIVLLPATIAVSTSTAPAPGATQAGPTLTVPDGPYVRIDRITVVEGQYLVEYTVFHFIPASPGLHMHFFFDTVKPDQAGVPGSGPWKMYTGPGPFRDYATTDRPGPSTKMCVTITKADHTVMPDSGNCVELPDV